MQDGLRPTRDAGLEADIGSTVKVRDAWGEERYTLVGAAQSDAARGRISVQSPVGRALLGRRRGERIDVHTPGGLRVLSILEVSEPRPESGRLERW